MIPAAFSGSFNVATGWVVLPLGLGKKRLRAELYGGLFTILAFGIGAMWGALGMATAFSCAVCIKRVPQLLYVYHGTGIKLGDLGEAIWPGFLSSVLAATSTYWVANKLVRLETNFSSLAIGGSVFVLVYLSVSLILPAGRQTLITMAGVLGKAFPRIKATLLVLVSANK